MTSPLGSFLTGALEEQNKRRNENSALMKELFLAKQKAELANMDAGEIINQIKLINLKNRIGQISNQGGQQGQQFSPPQQPSQQQDIQPSPQDIQAQMSLIRPQQPINIAPAQQPFQQGQTTQRQPGVPQGFIRVEDGYDAFNLPKTKLVPDQSFKLHMGRIEEAKEKRLTKEQGLRDLRNDFNSLVKVGGVLNKNQINRFNENLGFTFSINDETASGRVNKIILPDGKVGYRVLPESSYNRLIEEGKFTPEEQKHIRTISEEHNAWTRVINKFNELGVAYDAPIGEVKFQKTNNPFLRELGVFSIPARFELARQFADDPRYQAIAREVEIAFQKFRTRVTGAQASDKEIARLRQVIAKLTDQPAVFFETINTFQKDSLDDFDTLLNIKESFGRDTSQFRNLVTQEKVFKGSGGQNNQQPKSDEYQKFLKVIGAQ